MTTTKATAKTDPLTPGARIPFPVPGTSVVILLQRTDNGQRGERVYAVTVEQGPHRPDGWSYTYDDETIARFEATRAAHLFARYRTADAIEARRAELVAVRDEQIRRQLRRIHNPTLLADVEAELDTLLTLADASALIELRARMNALYAA